MFVCGFGLNWFKFIKSNQNFSVCALWFSASIEVLFQLSCVLKTSLFHRCSMVHRETNVMYMMLSSVQLCCVMARMHCNVLFCSVLFCTVMFSYVTNGITKTLKKSNAHWCYAGERLQILMVEIIFNKTHQSFLVKIGYQQ